MESILDISLDYKVEKNPNTKFVKDIKRAIEKVRTELFKTDRKEKDKIYNLKNEIRSLRNDIKGSYKKTVMDVFQKSQIILATCVGAANDILADMLSKTTKGVFDLVIIDECAQATEAVCWNAILLAQKLVLAGDHLQLPPTIKSKEAEKELSFTLFDRMIKLYGESVSKLLNIQYRMNEAIMNFSSNELYDGKLIADESVRNHKVTDLIDSKDNDNLHLCDKNLILVDTRNFDFYESVDEESDSKYNIGEANICKFLINYLKKNSITNDQIGVITPYSAQVNFLRNLITFDEYRDLEISTVDGFQGREKEIVILSLVRSNLKHEVGFLADNRRLNVAITRAKRMLVLICDVSTVSKDKFIGRLSEYFNKNSFSLDVLDNIMDYQQILEIKDSNVAVNETEKIKRIDAKEDKGEKKKTKEKKNKKKEEAKQIVSNDKIEPNGTDLINIDNTAKINDNQSKKVEAEFIEKLQKLIDKFINSKDEEYKIEGLSNAERRYIHIYAETKNIIHESKVYKI
jgi:ATP-dependent RNA/DNA helicase IGHMBP2